MMCYFPDPAPVVTRMEGFLKPGGVFFFDFESHPRFTRCCGA